MVTYRVHLVPTFHYDIAYLMTFEEYFPRLKHIYTEMLNLMERYPEYTFMFECALLTRILNELCPEHRETLKSLISSGRLEVLGFYIQVDNNIPSGESLIRNAVLAKKLVEKLGGTVKTAWMGDVFGQNAQLPQIVSRCKYDYLEFGRGFRREGIKAQLLWESLDGTRILAQHGGYGGVPFTPNVEENLRRMPDVVKRAIEDSATEEVLLLSGGDWRVPAQSAPETVKRWNEKNIEVKITFSSVSRFFDAVAEKSPGLQVVKRDMNPTMQGTYSSRIRLKTRNREVENHLITAEKLSTICSLMGSRYPIEELDEAWEKIMRNQFHDVLCGSCIDPVFDQAMQWYAKSDEIANDIIVESLDFLAEKIDAKVKGKAVLIFNPLSFDRRDIVKLRLTIAKPGVKGLRILDENGMEIPVQLVDKIYYGGAAPPHLPISMPISLHGRREPIDEELGYAVGEGSLVDRGIEKMGLREVTVLFVAEVPALGHRVFELQETDEEQSYESGIKVTENCIENRFYCVTLNENGTIRSIIDKESGLEFVDPEKPFANNLLLQIDRGDLYTILPILDGRDLHPIYLREQLGKILREREYPDEKLWQFVESRNMPTRVEVVDKGPVRAAAKVSGTLRFWVGINVRFTQLIYLYNDVKRIDFETCLLPRGKHYRIRVCFPTNVKNGVIRHEIPFGHIERPEGEHPVQNWIDYSDDQKGLCIINCGLPGNNVAKDVAMISLFRSVAFEYKGISEGGYEENVPHTFHYSIIPFVKDDPDYEPWNHGNEVNNPLIARVVPRTAGELPRKHSFMKVEPSNVVLSALTLNGEHILVRVYEAKGEKTECKIQMSLPFKGAVEVDCLDRETGAKIETYVDTIKFNINPFEIKTIRLSVQDWSPSYRAPRTS